MIIKEGVNMSDEKKPNVFVKIGHFFRDLKNEIKKVVWPSPKATFKNTGIVLFMIFAVGTFVFLLDVGMIAGLGNIMKLSR